MRNLIEKKKNELEKLNRRSSEALDLVTSTIYKLDDINTQIDKTLDEIKDAKQSLDETENGLLATREHNSKIAEKFKALIEE